MRNTAHSSRAFHVWRQVLDPIDPTPTPRLLKKSCDHFMQVKQYLFVTDVPNKADKDKFTEGALWISRPGKQHDSLRLNRFSLPLYICICVAMEDGVPKSRSSRGVSSRLQPRATALHAYSSVCNAMHLRQWPTHLHAHAHTYTPTHIPTHTRARTLKALNLGVSLNGDWQTFLRANQQRANTLLWWTRARTRSWLQSCTRKRTSGASGRWWCRACLRSHKRSTCRALCSRSSCRNLQPLSSSGWSFIRRTRLAARKMGPILGKMIPRLSNLSPLSSAVVRITLLCRSHRLLFLSILERRS